MAQPNILIVLSDQLRRQALSCYGDPNVHTEHIDRLASEGVRFDAACATFPVCVPFRFSFMTGEYAHTRDVPAIGWRMSPSERTLADELNDSGYETTYVGKWHLANGGRKQPVPRLHQGRWERWLGFELRNDFYDNVHFENDDPTPRPLEGYQTDALFDLTIDYLTRRRDVSRPFCAVLSVEPPHPPNQAPEPLAEKWRSRDVRVPPNFLVPPGDDVPGTDLGEEKRERVLHRLAIYYAMVENLDQNVGKLRAALRDTGLEQNTVVLFLSDHGDLVGSHARQQKQDPFEESVGIPLIAWGPNCGIASGRTVEEPVATEDLFPTILGLAGRAPPAALPGEDCAPLMRGEATCLDRAGIMLELVREIRPHQSYHQRPYRGFRSRRYKYTVLGGDDGMAPWQFFDLERDPHELENRIDDPGCEEEIARHHAWLRERMVETNDAEWLAPAYGCEGLNEPIPLTEGPRD